MTEGQPHKLPYIVNIQVLCEDALFCPHNQAIKLVADPV